METKPTSSPPSPPPIKSLSPAAAAAPSPSKTSPTDQIPTPERPIRPPRCARNRGLAFSLTEVKKVAMGLNKPPKAPAADQSDDELLSVEQQLNLVPSPASSPSKPRRHAKLPEKYEGLVEFFNSLICSVRLIRLKGLMTAFSSICAGIQNLTDRRFTYRHLAQLKFILPEAILIKKVVVRDESTCCMKAELQVTLRTDAIGSNTKREGESGYSVLRKIFRARVEEFSKEHPEGDHIPEEALPHPFNQEIIDIPSVSASASNNPSSVNSSINIVSQQQFTVPSHMPQSFQMCFSQKTPIPEAKKTPLICPNQKSPKKGTPVSTVPSPLKSITKLPFSKEPLYDLPATLTSGACRAHDEEFEGLMILDDSALKETQILEGTPAKLISTPARLMTATPEIETPKIYRPTAGCDSPKLEKSMKRSARAKLFQTPRKTDRIEDIEIEIRSSQEDDAVNFLPGSIVQMMCFSQKTPIPEAKKTPLVCLDQKSPKKGNPVSTVPSPLKSITKLPFSKEPLYDSPATLTSGPCRAHDEEFKGLMILDDSALKETQILEGTPAKLISTPARLMTATPEIKTPKRYRPTAGCDSPELEKSMKRSARAKLFQTPRKTDINEDIEIEIRSSQEDDAVNFLSGSIVQMIREKEKKALEEREAGVADAKRRHKTSASLCKLVDVIVLIFQSSNRSLITKQELYHKIISSDCSIEDNYEVEEKLKTLEELVPGWLSRKLAFGDLLYSINKSSDPQEVRRKVAEVN